MATNKKELQILLTLKDQMSKSLDNTKKHLTTFDKGVSKLGATIVGAFSVYAVKNFAEASLKAASDQQVANEKLASALSNVAGAREGDYEMLQAQATALQKVTAIADEEIVNNQALLATFQLNGDAIKQLIPRILDMGAANAGTGEMTEDLKSATLAVGKAFTSGVGILSRYGVAMTDAQKEAFRVADEEGKLAIITQVLDDNFKGAAETVGNTFAGRVAKLKNSLGDLKEDIGFALMPTIEQLMGSIFNTTESMKGNQERIDAWAKTIYRVVNFILGMGKALGLIIKILTFAGAQFYDFGKIIFAFAQDSWNSIKSFGENASEIFKAVSQAMKGDFSGAADTMKNAITNTLSGTMSAFEDFKMYNDGYSQEISDAWGDMGESMLKAVDLKGFKPVKEAAVKAYRQLSDGAKDVAEGGVDELGKKVDNLKDKYEDFSEKAEDSLIELKESHAKNLQSIRDDIGKTQQSIEDLNSSYAQERQSDIQRVAEQVVNTEEEMAKIQEELQGDVSNARRQELQEELSKMQTAYAENAEFIKSIETAVAEARRVAALTDLERAIEEYNVRRAMAEAEFSEKMARLQKELVAFQQKEAAEIKLYKEKEALIKEMQKVATESYKLMMENNLAVTTETIEAEIDLYKRLAEAIAKVRGGNSAAVSRASANFGGARAGGGSVSGGSSYLVGEQGPELFTPRSSGRITPNGGGGVNVYVSGNTISNELDLENLADRIGNEIVEKLNLNQRLAF